MNKPTADPESDSVTLPDDLDAVIPLELRVRLHEHLVAAGEWLPAVFAWLDTTRELTTEVNEAIEGVDVADGKAGDLFTLVGLWRLLDVMVLLGIEALEDTEGTRRGDLAELDARRLAVLDSIAVASVTSPK